MKLNYQGIVALALAGVLGGCSQPVSSVQQPVQGQHQAALEEQDAVVADAYAFNNPSRIMVLGMSLNEISGISFSGKDSSVVYAQEDESGTLYRLSMSDGKVEHFPFGEADDYEDIAVVGDQVYVLISKGSIVQFSKTAVEGGDRSSVKTYEKILPKGEYEGMAYSEDQKKLYVLCKECKADKKKDELSVFPIAIAGGGELVVEESIAIDEGKLQALQGKQKTWRPSAIAQHPLTKQWFIISSVNKSIAILNADFQVEAVHALTHKSYLQPEGLAFTASGDLWISNESGGPLGEANLLKISYTP